MTAPKPLMWKISSESMECTVQGPSTSGYLVSVVERSAFEALEQRLAGYVAECERLDNSARQADVKSFELQRKMAEAHANYEGAFNRGVTIAVERVKQLEAEVAGLSENLWISNAAAVKLEKIAAVYEAALKDLGEHAPNCECSCMEHRAIYREALAAAAELRGES